MTYKYNAKPVTLKAGQDLSSYQYRFVSMSSDGKIDPTDTGQEALGILLDDPGAENRAASVAVTDGDIVPCVAGGAFPVSRDLMSDANGRAISATGGGRVQAVSMEASSAAGNIVSVMLKKGGSAPEGRNTTTTTTTTTSTSTTSTTTSTSTSTSTTSTTTSSTTTTTSPP